MGETAVGAFLRQVQFFHRVTEIASGLARSWTVLLSLALVAVALDAVLDLPTMVRAAVSLGWVAVLLYVGVRWVWEPGRRASSQHQMARKVEIQVGISDNALINAVDFSSLANSTVSRQLVNVVVQRGNDLSLRTAVSDVTSWTMLLRWMLAGLLAVGLGLIGHLVVPTLYSRVLPRYLQPFADHPAFTTLQFSIRVDPQPVYQGNSALIEVDVVGFWLPQQADLQLTSPDEPSSSRVPLTRVQDGKFELLLNDCQVSQIARVVTSTGQSDAFEIRVLQVPIIEQVTVDFQFPAYTAWPSRRKSLNPPIIRALADTLVEWTVDASLPLSAGRLQVTTPAGEQIVNLHPDANNPTRVQGQLTLTDQTGFHLEVTSVPGAVSLQKFSGKIEVVADRVPTVEIVEPDRYVMAVEGWKVPVIIQADDDVALGELQLFVSQNTEPASAVPFDLGPASTSVFETTHVIDLEAMEAVAGDRITYFAVAQDRFPASAASAASHRVSTPTYLIEVITLEEFAELNRRFQRAADIQAEFDEVRQQLQQLADQRAEILEQLTEWEQAEAQDHRNAAEGNASDELTRETRDQQRAALQQKLADFNQQLQDTIDDLWERAEAPSSYEVQDSLHEQYRELIEQLDDQRLAAEDLQQALQPRPAADQANLEQAAEAFRQQTRPFDQATQDQQQQTAEDLARLAAAEQLLQGLQDLQSITEAQRQVAEQLGQLRESKPAPEAAEREAAALQALAQQQQQLHEELADWMEEMQAQSTDPQAELPEAMAELQELLEQLQAGGANQDQADAAEAAQQQDAPAAADAARAAAEKLEALAPGLDAQSLADQLPGQPGNPGEGEEGGQPGPNGIPASRLARTLQQLQQSLRPQRGLPNLGPPGRPGAPGSQPGTQPGQSDGQSSGEGSAQSDGNRSGDARQRQPESRMGLMGPMDARTKREQQRRRAQRSDGGEGQGISQAGNDGGFAPESLTPDARTDQRRSPSSLRGVPSHYREQGRAYLKRLNETPDPPR